MSDLLASIKDFLIDKRWAFAAIIIGTAAGFISAVLCVRLNLVIFGFNIMFIVSPLIAGFSEAFIARKKYGRSTGAISALLIFIIINIYGWFFPKDPITLNLFTLGGIALTIQAAIPILVNYLLFVVFIGTITYVIGFIGNLLARLTGAPVSIPKKPKSVAIPSMELFFTTAPTIDGKKVLKHLGLISVETVVGGEDDEKSFLSKFIKGNSNDMVYELGITRNEALKTLQSRARNMGANGVLGVNISYETVGGLAGSATVVNVSGNAVIIE